MSGKATGWVLQHGPRPTDMSVRGDVYGLEKARAFRSILIAIADAANADGRHSHPGSEGIASATLYSAGYCRKVVAQLVLDGWIEIEEEGGGRGRATVYRVIGVDSETASGDAVYRRSQTRASTDPNPRLDPDKPAPQADKPAPGTPPDLPVRDANGLPNVKPPTVSPNEVVATASTSPEVEALCVFLADSIETHRVKHDRPVITKRWRDDMGLLVRNGPLGVQGARPVPPEKVAASIRCVFADLADRDRNGFCWADQIQSPGSLRAKWVQLREARRRTEDRGVSASQAVVNRRRRRREAEATSGPETTLADLMFPSPSPLALMQGEGS